MDARDAFGRASARELDVNANIVVRLGNGASRARSRDVDLDGRDGRSTARARRQVTFLFFESRPVSACADVDLTARRRRRVGPSPADDATSSHDQCAPSAMSFHRLGRRFGTSADADVTSSH